MTGCFKRCLDKHDDLSKNWANGGKLFCNATWDFTFCWPPTLINQNVTLNCPEDFIILDPDKSTYRTCGADGAWIQGPAIYTPLCLADDAFENILELKDPTEEQTTFLKNATSNCRAIELFLFCMSLFSLIVALVVLVQFSTLKCHRTRIHKHLFGALIIFCTIYTITVVDDAINFWRKDSCALIATDQIQSTPIVCEIIVTLREYSRFCVFAWMFIEGFYLNGLVSAAVFGNPRFVLYYLIGWLSPLPFVSLWVIFMSQYSSVQCWHNYHKSKFYYIVEIPRMFLVVINIFLLINIIRVLVTKLQQNNSGDSQLVRKAIKATAVLTPLLGVVNLMYLITPTLDATKSKATIVITVCVVKLLPAIQGFIVALLYCFLNGEVLALLRRRWSSWRLIRVSGSTSYRRTSASVCTTLTDVRMAPIGGDCQRVDEESEEHISLQDPNQNCKTNGHV